MNTTSQNNQETMKNQSLSASELREAMKSTRQRLNLHHEDEFLKNIGLKSKKIEHYQRLADDLTKWIILNSKEKILHAINKGHGWTNIYQYLPTNHPAGVAQIMPMISNMNLAIAREYGLHLITDDTSLKYFAGLDELGYPLVSSKENNGVPIILLIQGPKIGSDRSLDGLRMNGLLPVLDQLRNSFRELYPDVKLVHRWVGKNGYIIEAIWDEEGYKARIEAKQKLSKIISV